VTAGGLGRWGLTSRIQRSSGGIGKAKAEGKVSGSPLKDRAHPKTYIRSDEMLRGIRKVPRQNELDREKKGRTLNRRQFKEEYATVGGSGCDVR